MSDRYHGFSLKSVCWGYRDVFQKSIEGLFEQGLLGAENAETTRRFFELLKRSEENLFDHVLYDFLRSLNPSTTWVISLPAVFSEVTEMGCLLAEKRIYYGTTFFRLLGEGGLGRTPAEMTHLIRMLKRIRQVGADAAFAFLKGYRKLLGRLSPHDIERYAEEGLLIYRRAPKTGLRFLEGSLRSSEEAIRRLSSECVLEDVQGELTRLIKALSGTKVEIDNMAGLDSDELIESGSGIVALGPQLYLPAVIREGPSRAVNRSWYLLCALTTAAAYACGSFPLLHGRPGYATAGALVGEDLPALNLFLVLEYTRLLTEVRRLWPGGASLVEWGLRTDFRTRTRPNAAETLLAELTVGNPGERGGEALRAALECVNCLDTAQTACELAPRFPELACAPPAPLPFVPDFLYRAHLQQSPSESLVADMKDNADRRRREDAAQKREVKSRKKTKGGRKKSEKEPEEAIRSGYVYDEWSQDDHDYLPAHCLVQQLTADPDLSGRFPAHLAEQARKTRRIFEWLKPDLVRKEKYLEQGEAINPDLLVRFLVDRRREPSPPVRFYEKPRTQERDLGTLILMDVSGSTGEEHREKPIIEIEKESVLILGEALASLGDRFAICGFSGQGRENCEFFVYKDFAQQWDENTIGGLLSATPRSSTRIGPALRHAGYLLSRESSRQRLILLVTDGRPMDSGYDPETRYAQFDVRMACEENRQRGVPTFAITTEKNSRADMELMFPQKRFAILPSIDSLPRILPRLYMRLTT